MTSPNILSPSLPLKTLYQFPSPTWIENLAIRQNGQIPLTLLTAPDLYLFDPLNPGIATLVHNFSPSLSLLGIVELKEDIFYVAVGNYNTTTTWTNEPGSYSIWEVDLTSFAQDSAPKLRKVTSITKAGMPNGLEKFEELILFADSEKGCVWKVDPISGAYEIFIEVEEMKPPAPPAIQIGINGIKIRDGYIYWSNTMQQTFCRIKFGEDGNEVEVLERDCLIDDFCFDKDGKAWFAQNAGNSISVRDLEGKVMVVGNGREVAGATACAFGSSGDDLFVVTTGGLANPFEGKVEGGRLITIDTRRVGENLKGL